MSGRRRSVYLDDETWAKLGEVAGANYTSVNSIVRRSVAEFLKRNLVPSGPTRDQLIGYARATGARGIPEVDAAIERGEMGTLPKFLEPAMEQVKDNILAAVRQGVARSSKIERKR